MIKHRNKPGSAYKKAWMQENGQNKFRTIVSEVSSFVINPVYLRKYEEDTVSYLTREKRLILSISFFVLAT